MSLADHKTSGKIEIRATALEPLIHGAGNSGNTQLLRMQPCVLPDGTPSRVPFISGNSIKHRLRAAAVQYALDALGVEDHSLTKPEVDLLFSGGHLSKAGAAVDLETARKLEDLFPALSMCGYSAGNTMCESKLRVSHLHLICRENAWRVPDDLAASPMLALRAGALRSEDFGTRHDMASKEAGIRYLTESAQTTIVKHKTKALAQSAEEGGPSDKGDSSQMIYDFQCVAAGAQLWGTVWFQHLTDLECAALASAFHYSAAGRMGADTVMHVGAKNSIGYGAIRIELRSALRVAPPAYTDQVGLVAAEGSDLASRYQAHLHDRRDDILAAIRAAVA